MKKLILAIVFLCASGVVAAQDIEFRMGEKTNKKAYAPNIIRIVEGVSEGQILVVEPKLKAMSGPGSNPVKAVKVRLCDIEWNDVKEITLANSKKSFIRDAFRTDNSLHVILGNFEDKKLTVRYVMLDASSLEIVKDTLLAEKPLDKKDLANVWAVCSPNGENHGVVYAVQGKEGDKAIAMMFDRRMNKLWEHKLVYGDVSNVIATDAGDIVAMQMGAVEDRTDITVFRVNVIGADGAVWSDFTLDADVSDVALLNKDGNKVLAVALEGKGGYGKLRLGVLGNRKYTALWGLVFDIGNGEITSSVRHPFTDEDLRAFSNGAPGTKYSDKSIYFVSKLDECSTPQGGAVLYQHSWHEETRNVKTGMTYNETVYSEGILLAQAKMDGELVISHIPQNNQNASWPKVGADLFTHGDRLYVVTNESKHETDEYTPDQPAMRSKSLIMANSALSVYWFTPDGKGSKKVVERERKSILATPLSAGDNGRFFFLTLSGLYPHISVMTLPSR